MAWLSRDEQWADINLLVFSVRTSGNIHLVASSESLQLKNGKFHLSTSSRWYVSRAQWMNEFDSHGDYVNGSCSLQSDRRLANFMTPQVVRRCQDSRLCADLTNDRKRTAALHQHDTMWSAFLCNRILFCTIFPTASATRTLRARSHRPWMH